MDKFKELTTGAKLVLGAAVALFIVSLFNWFKVGDIGVEGDGPDHGLGAAEDPAPGDRVGERSSPLTRVRVQETRHRLLARRRESPDGWIDLDRSRFQWSGGRDLPDMTPNTRAILVDGNGSGLLLGGVADASTRPTFRDGPDVPTLGSVASARRLERGALAPSPAATKSISSCSFWPTSPIASAWVSRSKLNRHGLRNP